MTGIVRWLVSIALSGATGTRLWRGGLVTPEPAGVCFVVGCGMALFRPAWQSSVSRCRRHAAAVALTASVKSRGVRSHRRIVVATAGAVAAFAQCGLIPR